MSAGTQARADRRALFSAACLGSGFGLSLALAYLFAGLAPSAHEHSDAVRLARATNGQVTESVLQRSMEVNDAGALMVARAHESMTDTGSAVAAVAGGPSQASLQRAALTSRRELDCLTEAVYFEARSESPRGQAAVAQVVMNRLGNANFPKTVCGVVFQGARHPGCQFSFACDGSMRQPLELAAWDRARDIAQKAITGVRVAAIGNATHYHTLDVDPYWGVSMLRVAQVGFHIFYRRNPHWVAMHGEDDVQQAVFTKANVAAAPTLTLASAIVARKPQAPVAAPRPQPARAADSAAVPAADTLSAAPAAEPAAS